MKGIILPTYQHAIDMQKHTNWTLQAMLLAEKRMTFGSQLLAKTRNIMRMNEIQKFSCLAYLRPRSRLFTNTPRREGDVVKKIRYG